MRHHYFHGCGFGAVPEPSLAAPAIPSPPVSVVAQTPTPQMAPTAPVPGVHNGLHHGVLCVPVVYFPCDEP